MIDFVTLNKSAKPLVKIARANSKVFMFRNCIPHYLLRVCCIACAVAVTPIATGLRACAQTPSADPSFEVASVKLVDPSQRFQPSHFWAHVTPAGASYWSMSLDSLISYAYRVESYQVLGPEWTSHDRFDIEARFPEGADKKDERRMLQALLKNRFKLSFHIENRESETQVLMVGKHGEKLTPSLPDPPADTPLSTDKAARETRAKPRITENPDGSSTIDLGKNGTQTTKFDQERWAIHNQVSKMTIRDLAMRLGTCLGGGIHRVVDETGIKGTYQLEWDCPMPTPRPRAPGDADGMLPSDPQGVSPLVESLNALGLKLEERKMPQDVYVIDHIEKPSEN